MKTIYYDSDYKCHVTNDGTMTAVETDFFDGMCDAVTEGYCYDTSKGYVQIYPWKPDTELDVIQRGYERQLLKELQENSIPISELEAAYQEGVNSAYG